MQRTHMKNAKKCKTCKDGICSILWLILALRFSALFVRMRCLFHFFTCNADPACAECDMLETGLYTAALPDQYCGRDGTSMLISAMQVIVWSRVGQSARLLGIVTRPILAVLSSSHHPIMQVSSETTRHRRSVCRLSCQRSAFPTSCHKIWNHTQCIAVVVTSERLGHWIVT